MSCLTIVCTGRVTLGSKTCGCAAGNVSLRHHDGLTYDCLQQGRCALSFRASHKWIALREMGIHLSTGRSSTIHREDDQQLIVGQMDFGMSPSTDFWPSEEFSLGAGFNLRGVKEARCCALILMITTEENRAEIMPCAAAA